MRFSLSATTALLLQVSTTAEAASSSSSTFLDAFEFGRSPPIRRKRKNHRGLVIQTESTRRMTKSSKADSVSSLPSFDGSSSSDAKASKKGDGYRLMPKATKQAKIAKQAKAFSTDTLGSIFMEPPRTAKADKITTDMSYSFANLDFSMLTSEFSMPVPSTPPPTSFPSKGSGGNGGGGDTGDDSGGDSGGASPSPTPRHHQPNNFHEVIFKHLSVCTGVELEMDCLTSTTIDALSTMHGGEATRARARRFLGTEITMEPTPSNVRVTRSPTVSEVTPSPTQAPPTPFPTPFPTSTATMIPTSPPTDQCRPEVNEADLLSILTTSKQECIDSGSPISDETFQSTLSSFLAIFDKSNTCWDSLCGDSDPTSDLFFKILFDQASECANVVLTVEECILDHILEVVFHSVASEESGRRVRRSLQDSCCEPTESDLNFYASYLLLSADAACAEKGSVEISTDEWNKATEDLVKLFGARECWGVEPCEEEGDGVVGQEVPTPSPTDNNGAISAISGDSEDVLPYYDGPILSEDGEVCTLTTDSYAPEAVRSLELSFYYQVETTSDSLDLGLIERALIALVCDDAGNERRLNELETEVIAVDASPEDVISDEYSCAPSNPGANCQVIKGAVTILLVGPIILNEETFFLTKIASLFPIALDNSDVSSITYLVVSTPVTSTDENEASSHHISTFGISMAATAVIAAALLARGVATRRVVQDPVHPDTDHSKVDYKGQDELTIAATAELTCASDDPSPKHHVVNEEEREHWRELGMEGDVVSVDV